LEEWVYFSWYFQRGIVTSTAFTAHYLPHRPTRIQ
jgi:hypothetical protein